MKHTGAGFLLDVPGITIKDLQEHLGHTNINSTYHYIKKYRGMTSEKIKHSFPNPFPNGGGWSSPLYLFITQIPTTNAMIITATTPVIHTQYSITPDRSSSDSWSTTFSAFSCRELAIFVVSWLFSSGFRLNLSFPLYDTWCQEIQINGCPGKVRHVVVRQSSCSLSNQPYWTSFYSRKKATGAHKR